MHIWFDIDNPNQIYLLRSLVNELKISGHTVTLTANNSKEVKKSLADFKSPVKMVGSIPTIFGLFKEQANFLRAVFLLDYLKNRNIDAAFSFGSKAMFLACLDQRLPVILFLDNYEDLPTKLYLAYEKCFFIISDDTPDQILIEKGFDIKKIARCKGKVKKDDLNPDLKSIKEITDKIELLGRYIPGGLTA